jgi:hypothetical protein
VQLDLMNHSGLSKVCKAAKESLQNISRDNSKWIDLERDLKLSYRFLEKDGKALN